MNMDLLKHIPPDLMPELPLLQARIDMAHVRLRMDIQAQCLLGGSCVTLKQAEAMIAAMDPDVRARLLAERT